MLDSIYILIGLFLVAILYASVGHGGATGYITVLVLLGVSTTIVKPSALVLNIVVSLVAFYFYQRQKLFDFKLFLLFAIPSIPASYLGSLVTIEDHLYRKILALCLIFPILNLLGLFELSLEKEEFSLTLFYKILAIVVGFGIGFLSGLLGIGGGILLTPFMLLVGYAPIKNAAAISALFIFVNSIAGLIGAYQKGFTVDSSLIYWLMAALIGGFIGAYYGSSVLKSKVLKYILALVLMIAAFKLFVV